MRDWDYTFISNESWLVWLNEMEENHHIPFFEIEG